MDKELKEHEAKKELEKGYDKATELLNNKDELEIFLQRLEKKIKTIPVAGDKLSEAVVLASLIKSYISQEYTDIPIGTIIAVVSALIYLVSPADVIPDFIPGVGYIDDLAVLGICWNMVSSDVEEYIEWREKNGKVLV